MRSRAKSPGQASTEDLFSQSLRACPGLGAAPTRATKRVA